MSTPTVVSVKGRPRSCIADAAIDSAALELFADEGFERFSIEAVAARAGVGKATIYRRFANRDELLAHAMRHFDVDVQQASSDGDFWDVLTQLLDEIREASPDSLRSRIMIRVLSEGSRHPHLQEMVAERVIRPRHLRLSTYLERGVSQGQLRRDLDIEATIALLVGPMVWLKMLRLTPAHGSATTASIVEVLRLGLAPASHL